MNFDLQTPSAEQFYKNLEFLEHPLDDLTNLSLFFKQSLCNYIYLAKKRRAELKNMERSSPNV